MSDYEVTIRMVESPGDGVLEAMLEAVAELNTLWYLRQWSMGNSPPNSAADAGVIWTPDTPGMTATFETADIVFRRGRASCGPIAALQVGRYRASERVGGRSARSVRDRHRVDLVEVGHRYWHAVHVSPWGQLDPTQGMRT